MEMLTFRVRAIIFEITDGILVQVRILELSYIFERGKAFSCLYVVRRDVLTVNIQGFL